LAGGPAPFDGPGKSLGVEKASTASSVRANKIGIAKAANSIGTISFLTRPEIAARETAKYGGSPGLCAFALQSEEYFLHRIFAHLIVPIPARQTAVATRRILAMVALYAMHAPFVASEQDF
jgi:hypothetical protein